MLIEFAGDQLLLLPEYGVFWPQQSALLCSDLHLGKDCSFRSEGVPVPAAATAETLRLVDIMLRSSGAMRLFILGDLFHAKSSLNEANCRLFREFLDTCGVDVTLVLGNHDSNVGQLPREWPMEIAADSILLGDVTLVHDASMIDRDTVCIAGHIHPAVRVPVAQGSRRVSCFWQSGKHLVMPACGRFTGGQTIPRRRGDRFWAVADGEVIALPDRWSAVIR